MKFATWDKEIAHVAQGRTVIAGIDEVGRGCWAGPLVACAYVFHKVPDLIEVGDSKALSAVKREKSIDQLNTAGHAGIGEVSAAEIDRLGLQAAQYVAYERALAALPIAPEVILLDGRTVSWRAGNTPVEYIIDGDALVATIAAASIVAKVYRDTYMQTTAHTRFPDYAFDKHVGYGTKAHQEALKKLGVTELHRRSFKPIKAFVAR